MTNEQILVMKLIFWLDYLSNKKKQSPQILYKYNRIL